MKNLPKILVATNVDEMDTPTLCANAKGIKTTGDPDVVTPPSTDTELQTQAGKVMDIHEKRFTDKSITLTKDEKVQRLILETMFTNVAGYVQQISRKVATAAGDVAAGEAVVVRCGFKLKKKGSLPPREFDIVDSGQGWFHLRMKAVAARAGYVWRIGVTSKKGVPPETFLPNKFTLECEVIITGTEFGLIYGMQAASILPVKQNPPDSESSPVKANKPSFPADSDGLTWSDFIYDVSK